MLIELCARYTDKKRTVVLGENYSLHIQPFEEEHQWPGGYTLAYYKQIGLSGSDLGVVNFAMAPPGDTRIESFNFTQVTTTRSGREILSTAEVNEKKHHTLVLEL